MFNMVEEFIKDTNVSVDIRSHAKRFAPFAKQFFTENDLPITDEKLTKFKEYCISKGIQSGSAGNGKRALKKYLTWEQEKELRMNNNVNEVMSIDVDEAINNEVNEAIDNANNTGSNEVMNKNITECVSSNINEADKSMGQSTTDKNTSNNEVMSNDVNMRNEVMSSNSKTTRINFLIDEETHKKLSVVVKLKHITITELLRSYINEVVSKNSQVINELMNANSNAEKRIVL